MRFCTTEFNCSLSKSALEYADLTSESSSVNLQLEKLSEGYSFTIVPLRTYNFSIPTGILKDSFIGVHPDRMGFSIKSPSSLYGLQVNMV